MLLLPACAFLSKPNLTLFNPLLHFLSESDQSLEATAMKGISLASGTVHRLVHQSLVKRNALLVKADGRFSSGKLR